MPRPPREQIENGLYHVTIRGNRRGLVFLDDDDFVRFVRLLRRTVTRYEWQLHAFCLMNNHYHLLLTTPKPNISAGMCLLNGHYARTFNETHRVSGHVFERRFHAVVVTSERHLVVLSAYIALNPVVAGSCSRPEDYEWSSYAYVVRGDRALPFLSPDRLLTHFAGDVCPPRESYRRYVEGRAAELAAA
jgi:putative transposase